MHCDMLAGGPGGRPGCARTYGARKERSRRPRGRATARRDFRSTRGRDALSWERIMLRYGPAPGTDQRGLEAVLQEKELEVAPGAIQWTRDRERVRTARTGGFIQDIPATSGNGGAQLRREAGERLFGVCVRLPGGVLEPTIYRLLRG